MFLNVKVGRCNSTLLYPIVNISYFDEISNARINLTDTYVLHIKDNFQSYDQSGSFSGNYSNKFCTNLAPAYVTYNWDLWGTFTLSKPTYILRVVDINEITPYMVSNNPFTNISFYLIKINESNTVTFKWYDIGFKPLDGTMRIYKCNNDGTKSMVESVPVIIGTTSSNNPNIQLLTQAYSYDIIIDGKVYTDSKSYSRCHVEIASEVTYFVNTQETTYNQDIGLQSADCSISKTGNATVTMMWGKNPENDDYVSGCVRVVRKSVLGDTEVFYNCSTESEGYSRSLILPVNNNEYVVTGELVQDSKRSICTDNVVFSVDDYASGVFGITGLLAAFLLIVSTILLWAGNGELTLIGAILGIVISWIIGILNLPWITVSSLVVFLVIIAVVGRYSRKKDEGAF
jgi:hypothetical protein